MNFYQTLTPTKKILPIAVNSYGLPDDDRRLLILDQIAKNPSAELLIFDKSDGPIDNELEYLDWIKDLNLDQDFILTTSNYSYFLNSHPKIVYIPAYYFTVLRDPNNQKPDIVSRRPYKISCLSRNPWQHKTLNLVAMRHQPWYDQVQKSFGYVYPNPENNYEYLTTDILKLITPEDAEYLRSVYPLRLNMPDDLEKFESNACPTFANCYIDYAPESRTEHTFISEKTWKPIFSGQLFLILGPVGIINYLRKIGIDVFDDIIDHGYDTEPNLEKKIELLMQSITALLSKDLDKVWDETLERRQKNLDLVYSQDFKQFMFKDLTARIC